MSKSQQVATARRWITDWVFAVLWATLPVTAGPALASALDPRATLFRTAISATLWGAWVVTLVAALIPRTTTLTLVRVVAPAAVAAAGWAAIATPEPGWRDALALASTALATVVVFSPSTGERYVNGSSYGAERRLLLRPPGLVVLGLVEAVWGAVVIGAAAGPLLLASEQWVAGALAIVLGWPLAAMGVRALHRLSQRWLVFVPAGLVLVDPLALADSISMPRGVIESIHAAPADTTAHDLTVGALGLAIEVRFTEPQTIALLALPRGGAPTTVLAQQVIFTPTRPGVLLREARDRGVPMG